MVETESVVSTVVINSVESADAVKRVSVASTALVIIVVVDACVEMPAIKSFHRNDY
ncbi:hypothetical protein [Thiolapillus sp.]|uniref:hypothetical protein n=1 Tax=Thiolapillus sp. TaxID=2017437 RepID=UPI0025E21C87|nr:hypothetical protein [Thiolapillus sp.]